MYWPCRPAASYVQEVREAAPALLRQLVTAAERVEDLEQQVARLAVLPEALAAHDEQQLWATSLKQWMTDCEITNTCEFPTKSFAGLWLTHTGFGLPLAIFLLRNYIVGLPRELLESAKIDGANHMQIFVKVVVPLSVPALASFSIFQFLWIWNDLLVAMFVGPSTTDDIVFPILLERQLGTFGDQLHLLNASAVISMVVPVIVFLAMQKYFIRGLLAGSVKGG